MHTTDHLRIARESLAAADREFAAGDRHKGSKELWKAASHALTALAQVRNWPHGSHRALKQASRLLIDETGDLSLFAGFALAEKFQANSCYDFMEDFELDVDRPTVNDFVERLLTLAA